MSANDELYDQLLGAVSDPVVTLQAHDWTILDANAARYFRGMVDGEEGEGHD